ncbi:hypothetical protein RS030_182755 [Cryptosporidium xiaoi]|uniref:Sec20 C-terminal domain-containing protein n=1 Tax=Cryptosporidium xiaoi TaxID=659607 RepID=A0AAV9XZX5_9CRYT
MYNGEDSSKELQFELQNTKIRMKEEIKRFHNSERVLIDDKDIISQTNTNYKEYESKLEENTSVFIQIKKKNEREIFSLWCSFYFFIAVCIYIVARRLGIVYFVIVKPIVLIIGAFSSLTKYDVATDSTLRDEF